MRGSLSYRCRIDSYRLVSYRIVSGRVGSCRVVSCTPFPERHHPIQPPLPPPPRARSHVPLLAALSYLHSKHIAHCDLSLENVLIIPSSKRIKIIDFGLAVATDGMGNSEDLLRRPGCGKPAYLAPEVRHWRRLRLRRCPALLCSALLCSALLCSALC